MAGYRLFHHSWQYSEQMRGRGGASAGSQRPSSRRAWVIGPQDDSCKKRASILHAQMWPGAPDQHLRKAFLKTRRSEDMRFPKTRRLIQSLASSGTWFGLEPRNLNRNANLCPDASWHTANPHVIHSRRSRHRDIRTAWTCFQNRIIVLSDSERRVFRFRTSGATRRFCSTAGCWPAL